MIEEKRWARSLSKIAFVLDRCHSTYGEDAEKTAVENIQQSPAIREKTINDEISLELLLEQMMSMVLDFSYLSDSSKMKTGILEPIWEDDTKPLCVLSPEHMFQKKMLAFYLHGMKNLTFQNLV